MVTVSTYPSAIALVPCLRLSVSAAASPKRSGLRGAVEYMGGMWDSGLLRFLDDPNVPIGNNGTERCLRGVVVLVSST